MKRIRSVLGGAISAGLLLGLLAAPAGQALAADYTNPAGTTIGAYSGTAADDRFTNLGTVTGDVDMRQGGSDTVINQGSGSIGSTIYGGSSSTGNIITNYGSVTSYIYGGYNDGANSSGGYNTINNTGTGTVGTSIYGSKNTGASSSGGYNNITNSGSVTSNILGTHNQSGGAVSSGGNNNITNSGSVDGSISGSYNQSVSSSGGYNTINNTGSVGTFIYGSNNQGMGSSGGYNNISNTDTGTVGTNLYGSYNQGMNSSGGHNSIANSNSVVGAIHGSDNSGASSSGGYNTINNSGSVGSGISGSDNEGANSSGGYNTISNSGSVTLNIYGSYNQVGSNGGGNNTINNSGTVGVGIIGSQNRAVGNEGGNNTINNSGSVSSNIAGSSNSGASSSGGNNTINNSGTVSGNIYGSTNSGDNSSSIGNTITNSGTVGIIFGSHNSGDNSSSAGNTINNSGTVAHITGSYNTGANSSSAGNTITNSGSVTGNIYGSINTGAGSSGGNDTITNRGTVGGDIYGEDGNDTVVMQTGPGSVGGNIDGGTGTDTIVYAGGTWSPGDAKVINFENVQVNATHNLTLNGAWNLGGDAATVNGGTLTVAGALNAGSLNVNSGTANIDGTATISGNTQVDGTLNVTGGGTLNTGSLGIGGAGAANIYGTTNVGGATTVAGILNVASGGTLNTGNLGISGGGSATIAGTATVSGATTVDGVLSVAGGGSLTTGSLGIGRRGLVDVAGALSTGSTSCDGLLHVNGTLNSPTVVIGSSGYLWGSGSIHGDITNYGTIAPGNSIGTLSVHSGLVFMPGSIYQAEISSDGTSDRIGIDGQAIIYGGRVSTALPQALYTDRFAWNLLTAAGGVSGSFEGVDGQPNSQTLSLHAVSYADHVNLEVWRKPFASFAPGGAGELGAGLDRIVPPAAGRQGDLGNLIYAMDWSYSREQIASTLRRLSPEMYTSYLSAGLEGSALFDGVLRRRQDETRLGGKHNLDLGPQGEGLFAAAAEEVAPHAEARAGGSQLQGWELWGGALGAWSSRAAGGGRLGWRQDLGGLTGGMDGKLTDWLSLGLGLGATQSRLGWGQSYLSGGLTGLHTGLYAGAEAGGLHGQAALTYSQYQANSRRDIDLPSASAGQATGDFRSWVGQARLGGGYEWRWQGWLTGPIAGLRYARIQQDGFQETGAGACGLGIEDAARYSMTSNLGWQASAKLRLGGLELMPRLSLEWLHEYASGYPETTARFPGYESAPFRVSGQAPVADMALLRAGLNLRVREVLAAFVEYDVSYAADYSVNAIQAGLRFQF